MIKSAIFGTFLIILIIIIMIFSMTQESNFLLISPTSEQIEKLYELSPGTITINVAKDDNSLISFTNVNIWRKGNEAERLLQSLDIKYIKR